MVLISLGLTYVIILSFSTISGHRFYVLKSFYVLKVSYVLQVFCVPRFSCAIQSSYFNDANFYHVFNNFSGSFMYNCEEVIHHDVCVKCGKVRIVKKERIIL